MDHIDEKYITHLSLKLNNFKKVRSDLYNCRCPLCGDSQKIKSKARGYFYQIQNKTNYKCHNCGASMGLSNFLKIFDIDLYSKYCLDKYRSGVYKETPLKEESEIVFTFKQPVFRQTPELPLASENINSKQFLERRKLDPDKFYYADKFKKWVNSVKPTFNKKSLYYEEERIVIPLYYHKNLIGIQGRAINYSPVKYITIMFDESAPKIYNYDNVDLSKKVFVIEGPFDSEFVDNSVAMCGADLNLKNLNISHPVFIYDNEPRNKDILKRMQMVIDDGYDIVIWPSSIPFKDVNLMIMSGLDVMALVENNIYQGLEATLKFNFWKKKEL